MSNPRQQTYKDFPESKYTYSVGSTGCNEMEGCHLEIMKRMLNWLECADTGRRSGNEMSSMSVSHKQSLHRNCAVKL